METVTIGCRLPNGIKLEVGLDTTVKGGPQGGLITRIQRKQNYATYTIKGHHEHNIKLFRDGIRLPSILKPEPFINRGVPKDLWDQWCVEHKGSWLLTSGALYVVAQKDEASIKAASIDAAAKSPQPLAPIDPSKPFVLGPDKVETADFQRPIKAA